MICALQKTKMFPGFRASRTIKHRMWHEIRRFLAQHSTDQIQLELQFQREAFALLTLGSLLGIPLAPGEVALRLLPHLEPDVLLLLRRTQTLEDRLTELLAHLGLG